MQFSSLTGKEVKSFIENIPEVVRFVESNFEMTTCLSKICRALKLWHEDICPFLHKTAIRNKDKYVQELHDFEEALKIFYACGASTFLTKKDCGDEETFYMHVLKFYIPKIAHQNLTEHELGIGVFTMQGFERRNKESKNTLRRFSNNKGNLAVSNLRCLYDVFAHGTNAV